MTTPVAPLHSFTSDGATVHVFQAQQGQGLPKHEHAHSHVTFVTSGRVVIRKENIQMEFGPESMPVNLRANEWHEIEALVDGTSFVNVFSEGKM